VLGRPGLVAGRSDRGDDPSIKVLETGQDVRGWRVEESLDTLGVHSVAVSGLGESILDRRALALPERVHHLDRDLFPDPQVRREVLGRPVAPTDRPPA